MPSLSVKQERAIAHSNARVNVWEGSTRAGKTTSSLLRWLTYVAAAPPGELAMFGRTRDTIGRNAIMQLQDPALFGQVARHVDYTFGAPLANILGRRVHIFGANDAQAEAKVRGSTFAGMYGDELTLVPQAFFTQALGRLSVPGSKFFGTTNCDSQSHWLRKDFLLRAAEMDLRSFHFTLDDNPSLTDEYKAAIKAEYTGLWYRRFIAAEWCSAQGAIYDMFDTSRHVVDVCPVIKRWLCAAIDYGTVNSLAVIVLGIGVDRRLYAVAEWTWDSRARHRQLTDVEYSAKLREFLNSLRVPGSQLYGVMPERIIVDPSAASFIRQLHNDHMQVQGANNAVADGIRVVSSLLATDRLKVHASCVNLIDELQSYAWDEKAADKGEDKPIKAADHHVDSLRYGIVTTRQVWRNELLPTTPQVNPELTFAALTA